MGQRPRAGAAQGARCGGFPPMGPVRISLALTGGGLSRVRRRKGCPVGHPVTNRRNCPCRLDLRASALAAASPVRPRRTGRRARRGVRGPPPPRCGGRPGGGEIVATAPPLAGRQPRRLRQSPTAPSAAVAVGDQRRARNAQCRALQPSAIRATSGWRAAPTPTRSATPCWSCSTRRPAGGTDDDSGGESGQPAELDLQSRRLLPCRETGYAVSAVTATLQVQPPRDGGADHPACRGGFAGTGDLPMFVGVSRAPGPDTPATRLGQRLRSTGNWRKRGRGATNSGRGGGLLTASICQARSR